MSYLPGQLVKPTPMAVCENHPDRISVNRIVGETDSWGSEFEEACKECVDDHIRNLAEQKKKESKCDICNSLMKGCVPRRDPDEGYSGRIYSMCPQCIAVENKRANEEFDDLDDSFDDNY